MVIKNKVYGANRPDWLMLGLLVIVAVLVAFVPHTPASLVALSGIGGGFAGALLDAQCVLSDAQAVTATAYSTNTYDTGAAGNSLDVGEPMALCFSVDVAAVTTTGDETYQFAVIQSANADLSSEDQLIATNTSFITKTLLVAGFKFYLPIPPGMKTKRYVGAKYITGGNADRAVTVTADIRPLSMIQNDKTFANGFTISS